MSNWNDTGSCYAAVGTPQSLIVDKENSEIAGAVTRGGELVHSKPAEHGLRTTLLTLCRETPASQLHFARGRSFEGLRSETFERIVTKPRSPPPHPLELLVERRPT